MDAAKQGVAPAEEAVEDGDAGKKKAKTELKFSSAMPLAEAVSYFDAILTGLKRGAIHLKKDGEELELSPPAHLQVEVKATSKKDREKIEFEISWARSSESNLSITSG